MLNITVHEADAVIGFKFNGELDMSTTQIMMDLFKNITDQHQNVTFDFSQLMFIDSTGVGHLLFECRRLQDRGHQVSFHHLNEDILLVFDLLGVPSVLGEECFRSIIS
jgi:anti-anti-sigma factor